MATPPGNPLPITTFFIGLFRPHAAEDSVFYRWKYNRRAGCGKSARPVRREGQSAIKADFPTPIGYYTKKYKLVAVVGLLLKFMVASNQTFASSFNPVNGYVKRSSLAGGNAVRPEIVAFKVKPLSRVSIYCRINVPLGRRARVAANP